ncbi:MAG: GTP pyrophosphokinase [Chloroflexota bacterium]
MSSVPATAIAVMHRFGERRQDELVTTLAEEEMQRDVHIVYDGLDSALRLCVVAHSGMKDKGGAPYAFHPIRVAERLPNASVEEKVTALLHDVVEDTAITLSQLRELGYPQVVLDALDCLTHRHSEEYDHYLDRVATNPSAIKVKLGDLVDNLRMSRIPNPAPRDEQRWAKYRRAFKKLSGQDYTEAAASDR